MDRDTHFGTVLIVVGLALAGAVVLGAMGLRALGVAFVGISVMLLLLVGLLIAAVLAWPVAYGVIVLIYWARPDPVAPSIDYTLDMGRDAGEGPHRPNSGQAAPPPDAGDGGAEQT